MYSKAYDKLFWGMLFIIFNFNLGPINILPNCVGYFLIADGLNTLKMQHAIFERGKIPALVLGVTTLGDIVNFGTLRLQSNINIMEHLPAIIFGSIQMLGDIYIIYICCKGIYLLAIDRKLKELRDNVITSFYAYFIMIGITLMCMPFVINFSKKIYPIMTNLSIIVIIASLFVAGVFKRAGTLLGDNVDNGDNIKVLPYKIEVDEEDKN